MSRKPAPVTVNRMPMIRCNICGKKMYFHPVTGKAEETLVQHVEKEHC